MFVTGSSYAGSYNYTTLAYDAATGARLWIRTYDPAFRTDVVSDLAVAPDGSTVFVTGGSIGVAPRYSVDYTTIAYDAATGTQRWLTRYDGPVRGDDGASAIGIAPDGSRLYVTGTSPSNGSFDSSPSPTRRRTASSSGSRPTTRRANWTTSRTT